jgi:hypothetical protein
VFEWHDHRMHYMSRDVPPVVTDKAKKTKISDYDIPIRIGSAEGHILGTVWWWPPADGGAPVGAIVALAVLAVGGGAAVVVARGRRRGAREAW